MPGSNLSLKRLIIALPVLIVLGSLQFAYVSYRHAVAARQNALRAAAAGDTDGYHFWVAMEHEEGGEYKESVRWGGGFLISLLLVAGAVTQARRKTEESNS